MQQLDGLLWTCSQMRVSFTKEDHPTLQRPAGNETSQLSVRQIAGIMGHPSGYRQRGNDAAMLHRRQWSIESAFPNRNQACLRFEPLHQEGGGRQRWRNTLPTVIHGDASNCAFGLCFPVSFLNNANCSSVWNCLLIYSCARLLSWLIWLPFILPFLQPGHTTVIIGKCFV